MRVLLLSWEYPPHIEGGLGRHVAELAPALARQGVETHVITPANGPVSYTLRDGLEWAPHSGGVTISSQAEVSQEQGVTVHRLALPLSSAADIYGRVVEANKVMAHYVDTLVEANQTWDLLHTHDWLTGNAAITAQQKLGFPLAATIHATERGRSRGHLGNDLQRAIDKAERDLIGSANRVIVCSRYMRHEVQTFFKTPEEKMDVVPNGVNFDELYHLAEVNDLTDFRAKYAAPNQKIVFTVSRLVHEKGVHRLVDATPRILAKCPNAKIIVAGRGPEAENLKRQAEYLGVSEQVEFIGFISDQDRDRLFKVANCAVFPSLYEPFGIVALEAMVLGCPVVVSDVGGLGEVVTHLETGITTYPDNPDSVAWGVIQALTRPDWTKKHTANARKWVTDYFNWPRIAGLTAEVYQRVLNQSQKTI